MTQKKFALDDWIEELTTRLDAILRYERELEYALSELRWRGEQTLGLSGNTHENSTVNIRERIRQYSMVVRRTPRHDSDYEQVVSRLLGSLVDVLREHSTLDRAIYISDNQLVFGLDLGVERLQEQPLIFMVRGLVDYAVEHSPQATADAFARMLERGERQSLALYSIVLFRGLHVEGKHDFAQGLSVMSWQEARQYIPNIAVRSLLGESNSFDVLPIGAVVYKMKFGPAVVPVGYDFKGKWQAKPSSFRHDALLLIDLLAMTHETAVLTAGWVYSDVNRQVRRLLGRYSFFRTSHEFDDILKKGGPTKPKMSLEKLPGAAALFPKIRNDEGNLKLALSRLALSQSRFGPYAASDSIIDVAIALEVMYQAGSELTYRLAMRASYFLEKSAEDRMAIYEVIKAFYKARSDIVRGRTWNEEILTRSFDVARRTLIKLAVEGGPSKSEDWDNFVIAGGSL